MLILDILLEVDLLIHHTYIHQWIVLIIPMMLQQHQSGQMTGNRTSAAATGNQDFGYIGGGSNTGGSNVDRMDYANDTATALAKGDLSVARSGFLSATGNASFGYFGGGPSLSSVDRVDYSNDTVTASPKGSFTINRYGSAGTGDANFGYFGGGSPGPKHQ